jgi:hypothetical protein
MERVEPRRRLGKSKLRPTRGDAVIDLAPQQGALRKLLDEAMWLAGVDENL